MNKNVSILIPVWNAAKTLDRCFESIQNQTYQNFEIICINNGSRDNSAAIIKSWQEKFGIDNFRIISNNTNVGITKALNQGLDIITTEFTARIDGDDWWEPTKLEKQINFLKNNSTYGIIGTNYINFKKNVENKIIVPETNAEIKKLIIKRNPFAHSCVVFRTDLIKELGNYNNDIYMGQDYELWLKCSPYCKFHNIQEFLCHRSIEGGISFNKQEDQMIQCLKTQIKYIHLYKLPITNYLYLIEPLLVIITPNFIKSIKRKLIG
jgi:glycosyltransferase involved in cell wall biosynthesis